MFHEFWISSGDDYQIVAMVFHAFDERLDCFAAEVAGARTHRRESICLVDKQHPAECLTHGPTGFGGGVTDVLAYESGSVDLDQMADLEQTHSPIQLGEESSDGCFTGSRISQEHQMVSQRDVVEPLCLTFLLDFEEGKVGVDLLFDVCEPNK